MEKRRSQFSISAIEELDLKHQGSVGGDHLRGRYGRGINESNISSRVDESSISSLGQSSGKDITPGREPAEGPDVAMTSPSHERWEQHGPDREPTEGAELEQEQKQEKSTQKHHYK